MSMHIRPRFLASQAHELIMMLALSLIFGCAQSEAAPVISQEQATAQKEIAQAVDAIFQSLERIDSETLSQSYSNSSDFILFTTDGSMADFQAAENHHIQWFKTLSSLKVTTIKEEFRFPPGGNSAICAWRGNFEMVLKSGGQPKIDFAITFIFSKIDNRWKVIYQHTAALPPVQGKPRK